VTTEEFNRLQADSRQNVRGDLPPFEPDIEEYRHELAEFNLSREVETQLLTTLWHIMAAFVDKGFSVDICTHLFSAEDLLGSTDEKGGQA
jgi:hypothetical protein